MGTLDDRGARILVVGDEPALRGGRVVTAPGAGLTGPAILTVVGRRGATTVGVRVEEQAGVPAQVLVVSDALAARMGHDDGATWRLENSAAVPLRSLTMECPGEGAPGDVLTAIRDDLALAGQCLWLGSDPTMCVVDVADQDLRVREVDAGMTGLVEIVPSTGVDLFLDGSRTGLDVVVLADCSASMETDDLPAPDRSGRYRTRLDALKEALHQMLEARLRVSGRDSQVALLRFADTVRQVFPDREGMATLDATAPPAVRVAFEGAVRGLTAFGPTDISEAILRAAELLDRYGRPDHDRLVVLVSDGNDWTPKTADSTGEIVVAKDDPVTLVEHLHQDRGIRFHTVGVSDASLYQAWVRRTKVQNATLAPDHPLLEELVRVGGGDPSRIGGIDVLEQYFSGLGAGLTRHVGTPRPAPFPRLGPATVDQVQLLADDDVAECAAAVERLRAAIYSLERVVSPLAGRELRGWSPFKLTAKCLKALDRDLKRKVDSEWSFETVLLRLHNVMVEQGPGRRLPEGHELSEVVWDIRECLRPMVSRLNDLRQVHAHDKSSGSSADQKIVERAADALVHYVGRRVLEENDAARWAQLRTGLLVDAADATEAAVQKAWSFVGGEGEAPAVPDRQGLVDAVPEDLSTLLDLRVRD
ncbi:VWA domain-containing protein [Geodermatophilus sp. URMC 61]|uniref:VWA domain-containing protein n=1 Tax=Geodermatophilus sp. URMC 61 TaxID=3423411 RepID=UPI00406C21EE